MLNLALTFHLLATVVWVGGMFFAHMALRPVVNELLAPPVRLPLLNAVLRRFFTWVWLAVVLVLGTGYWVFLGPMGGQSGLYVHVMAAVGSLMALIFFYIYFVPYQAMTGALQRGDIPAAGQRMASIRKLIGFNLILGLLTTLVGASKLF
jgi:uncharacterized membrane protein